MAITQAAPTSFKLELLQAIHNFTSHTFKCALYGASASLDPTTTAYTATGEVSGTGYSAGGLALTVTPTYPQNVGTVAVVQFNAPTWTTATFTAYGALIYNSSAANRAVAVLYFGAPMSVTAGNFTLTMPTADANNAIIRVV
jgi:hypothetical protein